MTVTLTPLQTLILWAILVQGGKALQKDIKPELKKASREEMIKAGLLDANKVKRGAIELELTDKGWAWLSGNMKAPLSAGSTASGPILQAVLARLDVFLDQNNVSLADFITGGATPSAPIAEGEAGGDIRQRIRDAYFRLTAGASKKPVRLHAIRSALPDIERSRLDAALLAMQSEEDLALMALAFAAEIGADDVAAALTVGGNARHVIYLGA